MKKKRAILYFKFKLSNYKATFVPREHEIYHQITAFIVVFDAGVIRIATRNQKSGNILLSFK